MKKLIEKFKSLPLPLRWMIAVLILWAYPFLYSASIGAHGWHDLNTLSKVLMIISVFPFSYIFWLFGIKPVINTVKRIIKKRKK